MRTNSETSHEAISNFYLKCIKKKKQGEMQMTSFDSDAANIALKSSTS